MGIQCLNHTSIMRFLVLAALCAVTMALPEGRRLRPEEHWRPAQARDHSKYTPRTILLDPETGEASWEEQMVKINSVAAQMRNSGSISSHKDKGRPKAQCGIEGRSTSDRIVGGEETRPNQFPWQVALYVNGKWICGGSIVSENYILTAGHCCDQAEYFEVIAGAHNLRNTAEPHRVEITSYKFWAHPGWGDHALDNDLALVELPEPLALNEFVMPVCLPEDSSDTAEGGALATVTGWGHVHDGSEEISEVLRYVHDMPVMTNEACKPLHPLIMEGHLCMETTGGKGPCIGDAGGPLVTKKGGLEGPGQVWVQQGIVSFGSINGCEFGSPAGFCRVSYYTDWIKSEISG